MWSFYQGTTSVTSTTEPTSGASVGTSSGPFTTEATSAATGSIRENLFSSSFHYM